jgi:hypothetical protein
MIACLAESSAISAWYADGNGTITLDAQMATKTARDGCLNS